MFRAKPKVDISEIELGLLTTKNVEHLYEEFPRIFKAVAENFAILDLKSPQV